MKYNEIELTEMIPTNWDGNTRQMLVWNDNDDICHLACVIGYTYIPITINGFTDYKWQWICNDVGPWPHCAEIPTEEKEDAMKLLIDNENKILELREENQELKTKVNELKNSSSYQTYCGLRNVIAKLEDKIANLKKKNKEMEEKNNKEDQIAWLNNQITNLQYELSQPCINCEYKAKQLAMYKSFLELIYETK